jgi:hypothetical protein
VITKEKANFSCYPQPLKRNITKTQLNYSPLNARLTPLPDCQYSFSVSPTP